MMKILLRSILFIALAAGIFFAWESLSFPCAEPLKYSLGSFDARFGITREEFLQEIAGAEKVWEDAAGKNLFEYAPDAPFAVNLIFDERQAQTFDAQELAQSQEKTQARQESLTAEQQKLMDRYDGVSGEYRRLLASFQKRLAAYNAEVDKWNKLGGAPPEEYRKLEDEAGELKNLQKKLEDTRREANTLADKVNQFSKQQVQIVDAYNDQVETYVKRYGEPGEFDQGDYAGTAINIYQFDDRAHLRLVLAHELGHALGMGHVGNPLSVMYHFMDQQDTRSLTLTAEDRAALDAVCSASPKSIFWKFTL